MPILFCEWGGCGLNEFVASFESFATGSEINNITVITCLDREFVLKSRLSPRLADRVGIGPPWVRKYLAAA